MKKITKITLVTIGLLAGAGSQAAGSAGWTVTGTITPSTCDVNIGNAGAFDFGTTSRGIVQAAGMQSYTQTFYSLGAKNTTIDVVCPGPTLFAISLVDNKAGTELFNEAGRFGLGAVSGSNIGSYVMAFGAATLVSTVGGAGVPSQTSLETAGVATSGSVWAPASAIHKAGKSHAFSATAGATSPDMLVSASIPVTVSAVVGANFLNAATTDVVLNGAGTVTVVLL